MTVTPVTTEWTWPESLRQHLTGVVGGAGFAEDFAVDEDGGVGGDDDGGTYSAGGDELGFGVGESLHQILGGLAGNGGFVDGGGQNREGQAGVAEDFGAARGGGGEDELGRGHDAARILHARLGNSLCLRPDARLLSVLDPSTTEGHC